MQPETERAEGGVALHCAIRKWRVADCQVEVIRQIGASEIAADDFGACCSSRTIRAVTGSSSIPVKWLTFDSSSGISAGNMPVPIPGSRIRPPLKPIRIKPAQTARTINSGVKCNIGCNAPETRSLLATTALSRLLASSSHPLRKASSPGRRKMAFAKSDAPKPVNLIRRRLLVWSCRQAVTFDFVCQKDGCDVYRARGRARFWRGPREPCSRKSIFARICSVFSVLYGPSGWRRLRGLGVDIEHGRFALTCKPVAPRSKPDARAVLPNRSMMKGSSCAIGKLL